uniref:Predicted protein n=1 Tax=Hordeum vulgare subsp. vulgare TaxID=112509 RepID=F2ECR6_HORVV|nr:predicted protein [Hordeum vulgare subsp. vulgare]
MALSFSLRLKINLLTYVVANARLATPDSESSSEPSSPSHSSDYSSESISLPINVRAFLKLVFLCDEDFEDDDFEYFFFFFESSELSSLYFFFFDSFTQRGQ